MKSKKPVARKQPFRVEELEPRVLFSADAVPGLGDIEQDALETGPVTESQLPGENAAAKDAQGVIASVETRRELVFIDAAVDDHQTLVSDLLANSDESRNIEVVVLDGERDGVEQISEALNGYQGLDAVHIVSHGNDSGVQLGDAWLSQDNLDDYRDALGNWADALSGDADLLFYGCNLAGGEDGRALIGALAELTGADVAASEDLTGSALLGGDWDLEHQAGEIEAVLAFSAKAQQSWQGVLADEALWMSTISDVGSPSGAPGLDAWNKGEALEFGGAGLTLEPGTTSGTRCSTSIASWPASRTSAVCTLSPMTSPWEAAPTASISNPATCWHVWSPRTRSAARTPRTWTAGTYSCSGPTSRGT
jgi:hypothetical protein